MAPPQKWSRSLSLHLIQAAQWTGAMKGAAFLRLRRQLSHRPQVWDHHGCRGFSCYPPSRGSVASQAMIERTAACFGIKPEWLVGDTAYGSAPNLNWLVNEQKIAPYIPVGRKVEIARDGTFSRADFSFDKERNVYICPAGKVPDDYRQGRDRRSTPLPGSQARLQRMPAQDAMLPEGAGA